MTTNWHNERYFMNLSCGNTRVLENVFVEFPQFYIPFSRQPQENLEFQLMVSSHAPGIRDFINEYSRLSEIFSLKLTSYNSPMRNVLLFNRCKLVRCEWIHGNLNPRHLSGEIILSFISVHQQSMRGLRIESKPARKLSHNWQVNGF